MTRARRGNACTTCRKRKLKCDSKRPICDRCIASGTPEECHYAITPAKSTVKWLQKRVGDLEAQLERVSKPRSSGDAIVLGAIKASNAPPPVNRPLDSSRLPRMAAVAIPSARASSVLGDPLGSWWSRDEMPHVNIRDQLIRIFATNRWKVGYEFNVASFEAALNSDPTSIHPALLNAIFLNASLFSSDSLQRLQPIFLGRTRRALAQSLAAADNLFDFMRGSALLGIYFTLTGRARVGHHHAAVTLQFALACGLHEITSLDLSRWPSGLLQPPTNLAELGERLNLFWMLFINDRLGCLLSGSPVLMPDRVYLPQIISATQNYSRLPR
ncbi:hypothetical protein BOTBODRAFT_208982 [Botryobasidium botryosum FD-172 SS1]|uniref:Zn(2)-C6 fungal-type domain-containing protein n=1 Tax=Botryobasidium botryosum (strain FD-172 SS1) TaxID=930990 RepID=A0A067NCV4_BOTB1|nr:hypothetical protein BOTBODRAFT_208982 [Botryobasidium botryosum FD-172 SS1]